MRPSIPAGLVLGIPALVLLVFLSLPLLALLGRAVLGGLLADVAVRSDVLVALGLSLVTTAVSIGVVVLLGVPLAYLLARRRIPFATLVETIVDLPVVLPPVVAGLALLLVLGRQGAIGSVLAELGIVVPFTTAAVVVAQVFVAGPIFVRAARAALAGVDRDIEDAARVDGAGELATLRRIDLPLTSPALAAALVTAWARALGEFGATILLAGSLPGLTQTLPLLVYAEFAGSLDAAVAAAAVLVVAAVVVLVAVRVLAGRRLPPMRSLG